MFKLMFHLLCTWVIICSLLSGCSKISKEIIEPVKQIKQQEEQASKPHPTNTQTIDYLNTWSSPFAHNLTTIMFAKESNYFQKKGEEKINFKIDKTENNIIYFNVNDQRYKFKLISKTTAELLKGGIHQEYFYVPEILKIEIERD